jgi:hypothetical protein
MTSILFDKTKVLSVIFITIKSESYELRWETVEILTFICHVEGTKSIKHQLFSFFF